MAASRFLLEDGSIVLLESADKLLLEDDTGAATTPTPDIRHYPRGESRGVIRGAV